MKKIFYLVASSLLLVTGCGIKGDPLPPAEQETVQKAEPVSGRVNPATNTSQKEDVKKKKVNDN